MVKHIFMAPIKEGANDEKIEEMMDFMRTLKADVPEIETQIVARNTGWAGIANAVTMVIDLKDKAALDSLMGSAAHTAVAARAGEVFDINEFIVSQIEY